MRVFAAISVLALGFSMPAKAVTVEAWNGFSVRISAHQGSSDEADQKAQALCETVGKSAERQSRSRDLQGNRVSVFYVCL